MKVTIIAGGRGARSIATELLHRGHKVTIIENSYDDGKSTGYVRRYLDIPGPSDLRKTQEIGLPPNASTAIRTMFDRRVTCNFNDGVQALRDCARAAGISTYASVFLDAVHTIWNVTGRGFEFDDMSLANCIYAGAMLEERTLSRAVEAMGERISTSVKVLPVSDDNLWLAGIGEDDTVFHDEASIVETRSQTRIRQIALLPSQYDQANLINRHPATVERYLRLKGVIPTASNEAIDALDSADLVVIAPGTMHSSIYPSLMHRFFATHTKAVIVTNACPDNETPGYTPEDFIRGILHYRNFHGGVVALVDRSTTDLSQRMRLAALPLERFIVDDYVYGPVHDGSAVADALEDLS